MKLGQGEKLARAVAISYAKLLAYKDEYEVARLFTDGRFMKNLRQQFEGDLKLRFNLAPPLLSRKDEKGHQIKSEYGAWIWHGFKLLARLKPVRGTRFDLFGYTIERKMERRLIAEYENLIRSLLMKLTPENYAATVEIATMAQKIRGFGHVKQESIEKYRRDLDTAMACPELRESVLPILHA